MDTPGEQRAADSYAETVAMMAARPQALKILSVELRKAVLKYARRIYMFPALAVCFIPIVIIQELVLGLDDTAVAWRWLRLGPPPRTYQQYARLVAANADWYLLPEPRRYYPVALLSYVFATIFFLWALVRTLSGFWTIAAIRLPQPPTPVFQLLPPALTFYIILAVAAVTTFLIGHALQRLVHSADALYFEAKQRLRELER